jgi:hypothetical protein
MMTADAIRTVLRDLLERPPAGGDPQRSAHHRGVIRGLLWAITGQDQGEPRTDAEVMRAAGIPVEEEDDVETSFG